MGLFSKKSKVKFALIPSTPEQTAARKYLQSLYQTDLEFPVKEVAELTPFQEQLRSYLGEYMPSAMKEYGRTLTDFYSPMEGPYWKGFRTEAQRVKGEAISDVRRRAQLGGMLKSSPAAGIEAETGRRYDSLILQELGELFERERERKLAVPGAMAGTIGAAQAIEELPRTIEQERMNAAYTAIIQELLAPYEYQWQLALSILQEPRYTSYVSQKASTFEKIQGWGQIAGTALLAAYGLGGLGSPSTGATKPGLWYGSPSRAFY